MYFNKIRLKVLYLTLLFIHQCNVIWIFFFFNVQLQKLQSSYKIFFLLKNIKLDGLMQHLVFLRNDELILLHDCFLAGNTQAKFVIGAFNYFLLEKTTMGKQMLHEANKEGETNAQYGLAIALICEFNDNGKQLLLSILNQPNGKHLLQNCRRILRHTTLGTKKFRLSNKQECNKEGVGHWDRDFPYLYGNNELYVKCKMCSIDLEIYKLANKLW